MLAISCVGQFLLETFSLSQPESGQGSSFGIFSFPFAQAGELVDRAVHNGDYSMRVFARCSYLFLAVMAKELC